MTRLLSAISGCWLSGARHVSSAICWGWQASHGLVSTPPPTPTSPSFSATGFASRACLVDCLSGRSHLAQLACMETRICTRVSTLLILLICGAFLFWAFREQLESLLPWLVGTNPYLGAAIFFVLFVVVALPSSIPGYIFLNIAAGYRYGLMLGTLIVAMCALGGAYCAFVFCRLTCTAFLLSKLQNDYLQAIVNLVEGEHSFKVIALTRLTPIPFGLQNGVFAMANVSVSTFVSATAVGLLPNQLLSSYLGSTLRSVQDITSHQWNSSPVVIVQVCLSISLSFYVIVKAQRHLHKAIRDHRVNQMEENRTVHVTPQALPGHPRPSWRSEGEGHDQTINHTGNNCMLSVEDEVSSKKDSFIGSNQNSDDKQVT